MAINKLELLGYTAETEQSKAALFTVSNGFYGCRGFFEERLDSGGIYLAGAFGKSGKKDWNGHIAPELLNSPNILSCQLIVDDEVVNPTEQNSAKMQRCLNMDDGSYIREYDYHPKRGGTIHLQFKRFASMSDVSLMGQEVVVSTDDPVNLTINSSLNWRILNLNDESTEPLPIQPGKKHLKLRRCGNNYIETQSDYNETIIQQFVHNSAELNRQIVKGITSIQQDVPQTQYNIQLNPGDQFVIQRIVRTHLTLQANDDEFWLDNLPTYKEAQQNQQLGWQKIWDQIGITFQKDTGLTTALKYNLFELYSAAPRHNRELSIGARGLTGEMYEGCVFWDLEIFKFPFFLYNDPHEAKQLLYFRYHTLKQAKEHAKNNLFKGAFYPWQVSSEGTEQTPPDVGAYYAIHVVADIAYAVQKYFEVTQDYNSMYQWFGEILVETARFWMSRVSFDEKHKRYQIMAVRGPNEYDVFVNNNAYTNFLAAQNLTSTAKIFAQLNENDSKMLGELCTRINLKADELHEFLRVGSAIYQPADEPGKVIEEDDRYFERHYTPIEELKPTAKRVIDSTIPYEALPFYQVTKQGDVVQLMNLFPSHFSREKMAASFDFYMTRTVHDSSLSLGSYAQIASLLGKEDLSEDFFRKSVNFDYNDQNLNAISGIHFANFGLSWQVIMFGVFGMEAVDNILKFNPHYQNYLGEVNSKIIYRGVQIQLTLKRHQLRITLDNPQQVAINFEINGKQKSTNLSEAINFEY